MYIVSNSCLQLNQSRYIYFGYHVIAVILCFRKMLSNAATNDNLPGDKFAIYLNLFPTQTRNRVYTKILSLRPPNLLVYSRTRSPAELLKASGLTDVRPSLFSLEIGGSFPSRHWPKVDNFFASLRFLSKIS